MPCLTLGSFTRPLQKMDAARRLCWVVEAFTWPWLVTGIEEGVMTGSLKEMLFAQTSTLEGITWCGITPSYLPHVLSVGRPLLKGFDWSHRTRLCMVKFSFHRMTHSDASRWPNYNGLFRLKLISLASDGRHSPVPAQTLRLRFFGSGWNFFRFQSQADISVILGHRDRSHNWLAPRHLNKIQLAISGFRRIFHLYIFLSSLLKMSNTDALTCMNSTPVVAPRISEETWEKYKDIISKQYQEGTLEQVINYMRETYDFKPTCVYGPLGCFYLHLVINSLVGKGSSYTELARNGG